MSISPKIRLTLFTSAGMSPNLTSKDADPWVSCLKKLQQGGPVWLWEVWRLVKFLQVSWQNEIFLFFFLNYCHIFVEFQAMEGEWWCHQMVPIHLNAMQDPHCKLEARKEIMWSLAIKASSWGLKWLMIPSWHIFACLLICWRWFPSAFLLVLVILDMI